jgi:hypothetical protein
MKRHIYINYGLHYKPMTIVNDDSRAVNKLEASLTDDALVVSEKVLLADRKVVEMEREKRREVVR